MAIRPIEFYKGSTYEDVFAIKGVTLTDYCNIAIGSAIVTGILDTSVLLAGYQVSGVGIPASTTILNIIDAHSITLTANATATAVDELLTFKDPNYVDITSVDFRGQIRTTVGAPTVAATFTFTKNTVARTVKMSLTSSDTALIGTGTDFVYDVEMYTAGDAFVTKIFTESPVIAHEEVTR